MKLTKNYALELLKEVAPEIEDTRWINHSICVGNTASVIAKALGLDPDYAAALGYVHDIGKCVDKEDYEWHDTLGYQYLIHKGINEEDALICLTHSYIEGDYTCVAGGIPQRHPQRVGLANLEYNEYQRIINLCDLMCTTNVMTMERRLIDLLNRKGIHSNTKHHLAGAEKLKNYFDEKLGYDVYLLFSEILGIDKVYICDNEAFLLKNKAEERKTEIKKNGLYDSSQLAILDFSVN